MSLRGVTELIQRKVGMDARLGAVLKFDLGDDGVIVLDSTVVPNVVDHVDREAQCTLSTTVDDLESILRGKLDPMAAFGEGRLHVAGDMSVAMKLGDLVRGGG